ncbi:MAG: hypothetical protein QXJ86_05825 [Nitrososphaerales archaeon]
MQPESQIVPVDFFEPEKDWVHDVDRIIEILNAARKSGLIYKAWGSIETRMREEIRPFFEDFCSNLIHICDGHDPLLQGRRFCYYIKPEKPETIVVGEAATGFNELFLYNTVDIVTTHIPLLALPYFGHIAKKKEILFTAMPVALLFKFGSYCMLLVRKLFLVVPAEVINETKSDPFTLWKYVSIELLSEIYKFREELHKKMEDAIEKLKRHLQSDSYDIAIIDVEQMYECMKKLFLNWVEKMNEEPLAAIS